MNSLVATVMELGRSPRSVFKRVPARVDVAAYPVSSAALTANGESVKISSLSPESCDQADFEHMLNANELASPKRIRDVETFLEVLVLIVFI
jgi:hypothetical protein